MRSYEAARSLFSFMSFIAWVTILGGIAVAIGGLVVVNSMYGRYGPSFSLLLLYMLPGVGISIVGMVILAMAQLGRAGVDTAEYSQQMLQLSRQSLDVSRQSLRQSEQLRTSFEALKVTALKEPSASYAGLRTVAPEQKSEPQPVSAPSVSYENRAAEPALASAAAAPTLPVPTPPFGSLSLNGSSETTQSS